MTKPILKDMILDYVDRAPGSTATQIAKALNRRVDGVSSALFKMCAKRILRRKSHCGPRGGWGYFLTKPLKRKLLKRTSAWNRLRINVYMVQG